MLIKVLSRRSFARLFVEGNSTVALQNFWFISINSVFEKSSVPMEYLDRALVLYFEDTIEDYVFGVFSQNQARQIKEFADNAILNGKNLIIHCAAGVSRSGAVGVALNDYANKKISNNKEGWRYFIYQGCENEIFPNSYVLKLLSKELGLNYIE